MRLLFADGAAVSPDRYRELVQRSQVEGLMADHLVQGEPYLAPNAAVLRSDESSLLQTLTASFASAFYRAGLAVMEDRAILEEWGFPWVAAELLAAEAPRLPLVGRFDFVVDTAGHWWLLEYNADTPSGIREAIVVDAIAHDLLPGASTLDRPNRHFAEICIGGFADVLSDLPQPRRLGLLTDASELEDTAQMALTELLLRSPLAAIGVDVVLGDVDNVRPTRSGISLCGKPVGAIYRYVPFEMILGGTMFAGLADASARGHVRLLNGLFGLLLQHKGLLAWLWTHRTDARFSDEETAAIETHLPPTWMIGEAPPTLDRSELVAKQVFGREGAEVLFGEDATEDEWAELQRRRTYIVQRRVDVLEQEGLVWTSGGPHVQAGRATVGAYAVNAAWGGYYTRFGGKIITSRAKWLATFAE